METHRNRRQILKKGEIVVGWLFIKENVVQGQCQKRFIWSELWVCAFVCVCVCVSSNLYSLEYLFEMIYCCSSSAQLRSAHYSGTQWLIKSTFGGYRRMLKGGLALRAQHIALQHSRIALDAMHRLSGKGSFGFNCLKNATNGLTTNAKKCQTSYKQSNRRHLYTTNRLFGWAGSNRTERNITSMFIIRLRRAFSCLSHNK